MEILSTAREVIDALGGLDAVAALCGVDYVTVSGWQARFGSFPPRFYVQMTKALAAIGKSAPAHLWKMREAVAEGQVP